MYLSGDSNMRRARLDLADFDPAVAEASFDQKSACEDCSQVILRQIQRPMAFLPSQRVKLCEMSSRGTRGLGAVSVYQADNTKLDHDFGTRLLPETRAKQ
jgi:hypothetical protein